MDAPCTIILVKQALPFELLGGGGTTPTQASASQGYSDSDSDAAKNTLYGDDLGPLG